MLKRLLSAVAITAMGTAVVAQSPEAAAKPSPAGAKEAAVALDRKIMTEVQTKSEMMKNLSYLSDVIGPRITGSPGLEKANKWAAEIMKSYGLVNVRQEPWEIPLGWERGTASLVLKDPMHKELTVASYAWAPGTKGKLTGPVVLVEGRTKADLEKYKGKLKNAVILRGEPSEVRPITDNTYRTPPPTPAAKPADKKPDAKPETKPVSFQYNDTDEIQPPAEKPAQPPAAQPPGGADFLNARRAVEEFLKDEGVAASLIDSGKPHGLLNMTGSWPEGDRGTPPQETIPKLFITHDHYALLYRLVKEHKLTPTVEVEITNKFIPGPITVYNTIGEITGTEFPNEFVVVGAHLDSWDLGQGTTDNGTGSCVILESARVLFEMAKAGFRPKRTIRFILFTGEEEGLHGSKQYVKRHESEMAKHSGAIVHDTGTGKVLSFGVLGRTKCQQILGPELETLKDVGFTGMTSGGLRGGTDHWSFHTQGIPGFACSQDPDEYRFTHHSQSDTFDKAKHPALIQGAQVMSVTATRIANLPELLPHEKIVEAGGRGGLGGGGAGGRPRGGNEKPAEKPAEKKPEEKKPK